jgi:dephospho-CoA kinase
MIKVGLTGGIGSGKSMVAAIFKTLGIPVFDADAEAKKLMESNPALQSTIQQTFGVETYSDGKLNRQYLAKIVFNNAFQLEKLNALVHPIVIEAADSWASKQKSAYVIKEAALMFESGSAANLDFVIGVFAPQHLRIKRVMDRDGLSRLEVLSRMDKQISDGIKMKLCDFVLINDEQQLLLPQVIELHEKLEKIALKN